MRIYPAAAVALSILASSVMFAANPPGLSITNYRFVNEEFVTRTQSKVTYRADLTNNGPAQASVTATVTSAVPGMVIPGQDVIHFAPVPGNSVVTSNDTFTILVNRSSTFDFNSLVWTLVIPTQPPPIANAGPDQAAVVGKLVTLSGSGSSNPSGVGTLTYSWVFTTKPAGSSATLNNPSAVMPTFTPDIAGDYVITLTVSNGVASASASTKVSTVNPPAPVANAGPDQSVLVGATVTLNGSASKSLSNKPLTYAFSFVSKPAGSNATLTGSTTVTPTFVPDVEGNYIVQLIVNDGLNSDPATVKISVGPKVILPPTANAGPSQTLNPGSVVQLNGSGSTDPQGLPLTFKWSLITLPPGSTATLSSTSAVNPTFTADRAGTYVAQLIVNNGTLDSAPSTVTITISTLPPTANAGSNQTVDIGQTVQLNGSGTDPQSLPLTYLFTLLSKPAGSNAALSSTTVANPTFVPDVAGDYVFQLVVNNGALNSAPSTVTVSTRCAQPTARPGANQDVFVGTTVTLNGSTSGPGCQGTLTYAFSFTNRPAGSNATLSGANTVSPTFVPDVAGMYVVQLIVNNGLTNSQPQTVTINATSRTIALSPSPLTVNTPVPGTLTVTLSSPPAADVVVTLSSSAVGVATVPATVTVGAGQTTATAAVTGVSAGTATITASAPNYVNGTATVNVQPSGGIALGSVTVPVGQSVTIPVTLASAAPADVTITLSSSNTNNVTISPATVTILKGQTAPATQPTVTGVAFGTSTISASANGFIPVTQTVQTTITMTLAPGSLPITVGNNGTLTLTLSAAAPTGGLTVNLSSADSSVATVPATVTVVAGATTATFQVAGVKAGSSVITASATNAGTATATANVSNPGVIQLPSGLTVAVGQSTPFAVTLKDPAPTGGVTITLTSSDPTKVTLSTGSVTIAAGATAPAIQPTVTGVAFGSSTITASAPNFTTATTTVQTTLTMTLTPPTQTVTQGQTGNLTVTLSGPAPTGGLTVTLASDHTNIATVPGSVQVAAGATTATFAVSGVAPGGATITASATNAGSATAAVTVAQQGVIQLPANPTVPVGQSVTFPVTLSVPAPVAVTITLASSDTSKVTITPATVNIAAGQTAPAAQPQINGVGFGTATITASAPNYATVTATVQTTITMTLTPSPLAIPAGLAGNLTLTLSSAAPSGGLTVALSSNNGNATVLGTVVVAAGATTANVPVTAVTAGSSTITANAANAGTATATVNVGPQIAINLQSGVSLAAGSQAPIAVTLSQAAPAGGVTINLISSAPGVATVTSSVTIVAGQTTPANQPVVSGLVPGNTNITATGPGLTSATQTVMVVNSVPTLFFTPGTLTINVPTDPNSIPPNKPIATQQFLTLSLALPTQNDLILSLGSSNTAAVTVQSTITIPAGFATVLVPVIAVGNGTATITANGNSLTASATVTGVVQCLSCVTVSSTSVGKGLQGQLFVTLPAPAASPTSVTVTSSDPSKVLLGGGAQQQVTLVIDQGATFGSVSVRALDSTGSVNVSASTSGLSSGTGAVTLTPSGFVLIGPNGAGKDFTVGFGSIQPLTVASARLDAAGNFVEQQATQQSAATTTVSLSSSNTGVGTLSPTSVIFTGGDTTRPVNLTTRGTGTTTLSVNTPAGFTQAKQGSTLVATVGTPTAQPQAVTVGKGLEIQTNIVLGAPNQQDNDPITITSTDASKVLFSATPDGPGQPSITLNLSGFAGVSPDFYVYGLVSNGTVSYSASAAGYTTGTNTITFRPSGFILVGPGGIGANSFLTTVQNGDTALTVRSVVLNADNSFSATQPLAGGPSVSVPVTSSQTNVGTITVSTVTIAGGSSSGATAFHPVGAGTSNLIVGTPSGFSTPTPTTLEMIVANVVVQGISATGDSNSPVTIGQGLEVPGFVTISPQQTTTVITLTSSNPAKIKLSNSSGGVGTTSIQVVLPAGTGNNFQTPYFIQGVGNSGTASYTASASGFASKLADQISLLPSGVVISGPNGFILNPFTHQPATVTIPLAGGPKALIVQVGPVNPDGTFLGPEALAGQAVTIQLTNSNPSIGTVPTSVVLQPGNDSVSFSFTPLAKGNTTVGVTQPAGFTAPTHAATTSDAPFTAIPILVN